MKNKKIIILLLLCFSFFLTGCGDSSIQEELDNITYPYPDSKDVVVSLEEYNQLKNGMTEDEVWEIIGGKCTNTGNTDLGMGEEYITTTYGCNGSGKTGANAILIFQGGTLNSMSQAGLK